MSITWSAFEVPTVCWACRRWATQRMCPACADAYAQVKRRCPGCALALAPGLSRCQACRDSASASLSLVYARVDYEWPWTEAVAAYKFNADLSWSRDMAKMMLDIPGLDELLNTSDGLIPIPLATSRLLERGYNQSWELIKQLRHYTGARGYPDALKRLETALLQHTLSLDERRQHAQRALTVNSQHVSELHGRHWVLVDDVMTTGATLHTAAQLLLRHGARRVSALVFARTPQRLDGSADGMDQTIHLNGME